MHFYAHDLLLLGALLSALFGLSLCGVLLLMGGKR